MQLTNSSKTKLINVSGKKEKPSWNYHHSLARDFATINNLTEQIALKLTKKQKSRLNLEVEPKHKRPWQFTALLAADL